MKTIQENLWGRVLSIYPNAEVKKINKDNYLDIYIPDLHEKKGTHLFFNTKKKKIQVGFYCREEDFINEVLEKSILVEKYSKGIRLFNNPEFEDEDSAISAAKQLIEEIVTVRAILKSKIAITEKDDLMEENLYENKDADEGGFPMLTFHKQSAELEGVAKKYLMRWQKPSQVYAWRMGIKAFIPEFVTNLCEDEICPIFTSTEIDTICSRIKSEKIIPILEYVPNELYNYTKHVWWLIPFCIWKEDVASLVFIDKNGFYGMFSKNGVEAIDMIFNWDQLHKLEFELEFEGDSSINRLTLYQEDGRFLTLDEFVSPSNDGDHGSYLSVIEAIWEVRKKTIEASKGEPFWSEGAGGEGFTSFEYSNDLCDEYKWFVQDRPNPDMFVGTNTTIINTLKRWPDDFLIAVSMVAANYFEYASKFASMEDFHQKLSNKLFDGDWEKFCEAWPSGKELNNSTFLNEIKTWDDVFNKIKDYYIENIGYESIESEYDLSGIFYDMWIASCRDLATNYAGLKPLYKISFQGSLKDSPPYGYLENSAKRNFKFISTLYNIFGKKHLWKAFLSRLENPFQFFQIGYQLINDFNFNQIDNDTVRYIATYKRFGAPHINSLLPSVKDFSHAVLDLFKVDSNLCSGLSNVHMNRTVLSDKISDSEYNRLKNRARKVSCALSLQVALVNGVEIGKTEPLFALPSGKSLRFNIWVLNGITLNYQNYYDELVNNTSYIVLLKNYFAEKLIQDASDIAISGYTKEEVWTGSYFLQNHANWQISMDDFTFPTKCFTGDLRIKHLQDSIQGTGEIKITLSGQGAEFIQGFISNKEGEIFKEKYGNSYSKWDQFCREVMDLQGYFELPSISHATGILKDMLDLKIEFGEKVIFDGSYTSYLQKYFKEEEENENDRNQSRAYGKYLPEFKSTNMLVSVATSEEFHYELSLPNTDIFYPRSLGVKFVATDEFGLGTIDLDLVLGVCYNNAEYDADYPGIGQISLVKIEPDEN
ncbi:hypothetical protein ACMH5Q_00710 [Aquirufa lenticrescens]